MTEAEVITRVRERLDESLGADSQRYTTADLTEYIGDGSRYYVAVVGNQYQRVTITAVADQLLYELPCDFIQVERVLWNSTTKEPLEPVGTRSLDEQFYKWEDMTDTRSSCYFRHSARYIGLWPVGDADEQYIVHYQQDVPDDITAVPVEDHEAIVDYVLARCLLTAGKAKDGGERYGAYAAVVEGARKRRSSLDRQWSMSGYGGIRG